VENAAKRRRIINMTYQMIRLPNVTGKWRFSLKGMNLENTDDRFEREVTPEIAPPEDWTPYCYDESKKICSMIGLVNDPPKCWKDCPYRKKDEP